MSVLFFYTMRYKQVDPEHPANDRFILSKVCWQSSSRSALMLLKPIFKATRLGQVFGIAVEMSGEAPIPCHVPAQSGVLAKILAPGFGSESEPSCLGIGEVNQPMTDFLSCSLPLKKKEPPDGSMLAILILCIIKA